MALLLRTGRRGNGEIDAGEDDPRLLSVHPACNNPDAISQVILGLDENAPTMTVFVRGAAATRRWGGRISPATEVHLTRYIELGQGFRYGQSSYSALCKHASHAAQSVKPSEPKVAERNFIENKPYNNNNNNSNLASVGMEGIEEF